MDVAITAITTFAGKDGREWVKVSFLKKNGEVGEKILSKGQLDTSHLEPITLPENAYLTKLSFDERGRLVDIQ